MRQRVLYFNAITLLLSEQYLKNSPNMKDVVETTNPFCTEFFNNIQLDANAISLLTELSRRTKVLLYPLQQRFTRKFLIEQGFDDSALAPNASYKVRFGDSNEVNHRIAHAAAIDADWFIISDQHDKTFLQSHFPDQYIDAGTSGVTPELMSRLYDKFTLPN